jgi:hypothetical protein
MTKLTPEEQDILESFANVGAQCLRPKCNIDEQFTP